MATNIKKKLIAEFKNLTSLEKLIPQDWDLIWVLSAGEIYIRNSLNGEQNETQERLETGIKLVKNITAKRLGKRHLSLAEIKSHGPKIYFSGYNDHNRQMKKYYLLLQICTFLLLIFISPCYAQRNGNIMFHGAIKDKAGNLWFATTGADAGVYHYDAATKGFTNFTKRDGLCDNNIGSIMEDREGNLWFNSENGVCRYDARRNDSAGNGNYFTTFTTKEGLCQHDINVLLEDRSGNFWFGTNGWGICRYDPRTSATTGFTKEEGLGSNFVQCMLQDKAGNIWAGERAGGVSRFDSSSGRFTKVSSDCLSSQIMGILEDKKGNIWFANLYDGLCRYEPASGKFTHLTEADGLCHNFVTCIYEDKKGNIWFGSDAGNWKTEGGGLCCYDGKTFTRFTAKDGLTNFNVWTIVEDNDGIIWAGTKGGLYRYHSPSGKFIDYTFKLKSSN